MSQVWLNVIILSGTFGSGCQELLQKKKTQKVKRGKNKVQPFENLQSKNEWTQLNTL